jgi:putative transposase
MPRHVEHRAVGSAAQPARRSVNRGTAMGYDPQRHHRRSVRLPGYDYASAGAYFVTIVVRDRLCALGRVEGGQTILSPAGWEVRGAWEGLAERWPSVQLDAMVVMPNHVHGVVCIISGADASSGTADADAGEAKGAPALGEIVRVWKAVSARRIRARGQADFQWQRSYFERVIRSEAELARIREYIANNPAGWDADGENPARTGVPAREPWAG